MKENKEVEHDILDVLDERWSPRAFQKGKVIPEKQIKQLFEAARWAPSSYNEQPWRYVYASSEQPEEFKKLYNCLNEFNQKWAGDASLLIIALAYTKMGNGKPNRHSFHDTGAANLSIALQAQALGLYAHQMVGYEEDEINSLLDLDEHVEIVDMIAVGHKADKSTLPEGMREKELPKKERNLQEEFAKRVK